MYMHITFLQVGIYLRSQVSVYRTISPLVEEFKLNYISLSILIQIILFLYLYICLPYFMFTMYDDVLYYALINKYLFCSKLRMFAANI